MTDGRGAPPPVRRRSVTTLFCEKPQGLFRRGAALRGADFCGLRGEREPHPQHGGLGPGEIVDAAEGRGAVLRFDLPRGGGGSFGRRGLNRRAPGRTAKIEGGSGVVT